MLGQLLSFLKNPDLWNFGTSTIEVKGLEWLTRLFNLLSFVTLQKRYVLARDETSSTVFCAISLRDIELRIVSV